MFNPFRRRKAPGHHDRLRSLQLFVDLSPGELRLVESLLHERNYLAGEVVFDEGEEGQAIYIVLEGEVGISRKSEGSDAEVARLGEGTFFGELALLVGAPRSADAIATRDTRLAVLFREDFLELLETHGRIASKITRRLARHVGERLREMALGLDAHQHI